jgi:uncharacterized protein YdhG (YjbR/CyaY superfamily)
MRKVGAGVGGGRWEAGGAMAKSTFMSVDEYIAAQPEDVRGLLQRVRDAISSVLPGADEVISYGIPTYKVDGRYVIYFAGWKQHYSIYPVTRPVVAALKKDLAPYEISKGTIRFPLSRRVPVRLIRRITKLLAAEAADRAKAKLAQSKKRK